MCMCMCIFMCLICIYMYKCVYFLWFYIYMFTCLSITADTILSCNLFVRSGGVEMWENWKKKTQARRAKKTWIFKSNGEQPYLYKPVNIYEYNMNLLPKKFTELCDVHNIFERSNLLINVIHTVLFGGKNEETFHLYICMRKQSYTSLLTSLHLGEEMG